MHHLTFKRKMYTYHVKEMVYVATCRKTVIRLIFYCSLLLIAIVLSTIPHLIGNKIRSLKQVQFAPDLKYILFWSHGIENKNYYISNDGTYISGQNLFIKQNCKHVNCFITYNRSLFESDEYFDAVVFNVDDTRIFKASSVNLKRYPHQMYIFKSSVSAEKHPICDPSFDKFFNWTWTYKLHSDIPEPFFHIYNRANKLVGPKNNMEWIQNMKRTNKYKDLIKGKTKAVAWIITKCKLKNSHQVFVKELQEELKGYNYTVDTLGPCGKKNCQKGRIYKCYEMVERNYHFILVPEDSITEDYVSDKMVQAMTRISIPIVIGGADYKNFLPPGSYINAQFFDLKKLGALIDYLIKNPKIYEYFFDWKNHYYYTLKPRSYICNLCNKLNQHNSSAKKTYKRFREWWNPGFKDACQRMDLLEMFSK